MAAVAWPQSYKRTAPTVKFRFDTTTGLNLSALGTGGAASISSEIENTSMLKCVTGSGANLEVRYTASWSNTRQSQGLLFYVPDYTKLSSLLFYSGDSGFTNFGNFTYSFSSSDKQYNGWHYADLYPGGWSVGAGSGFTSSVADWKVRVTPQASTIATVYLHTLEIEQMQRPKVILTYDDGEASAWTDTYGIAYVNSLGIKASLSIVGEQIDSDARWLTSAQLSSIYAAGNDLMPHGAASLAAASGAASILADVTQNQQFLIDRGYDRAAYHFVYPEGVYQITAGDETILNMLRARGMKSARTTVRQITYAPQVTLDTRMMLIPVVGWLATDSAAGILTQIDAAILRGHTCVLMFHSIVASGASSTEINSADHKTIVDGIAARINKGLIDAPSWSEWYLGLTQPALVA